MTGTSLAGIRIGVTAARRAEEQMRLLADRGATCLHGPTVAIPRNDPPAEVGRPGATLVPASGARWPLPDDRGPAERLVRATCEGRLDAVTFTVRPAVENLLEIAEGAGAVDDLVGALGGAVAPVCMGEACAGALRELGVDPLVAPRHRLDAMVELIVGHFDTRSRVLDLGDHRVVVQGRLVSVDGGEAVALTDREREVLAALAERPGAVLSKRALLDRVWGAGESDEHVVEVTIARLRRRLGSASGGIETVIRRGYRLRVSPV